MNLAQFVGKQPKELKHVLHTSLDECSARSRRRFVNMQAYLSSLWAHAINPSSPDQLIAAASSGIIDPSMKDIAAKEFDHIINLYQSATEKKVLSKMLFLLYCLLFIGN